MGIMGKLSSLNSSSLSSGHYVMPRPHIAGVRRLERRHPIVSDRNVPERPVASVVGMNSIPQESWWPINVNIDTAHIMAEPLLTPVVQIHLVHNCQCGVPRHWPAFLSRYPMHCVDFFPVLPGRRQSLALTAKHVHSHRVTNQRLEGLSRWYKDPSVSTQSSSKSCRQKT